MLRDYRNWAAILLITDDILGGWGGRRRISDEETLYTALLSTGPRHLRRIQGECV
jgi:hypothetical protein